ncbi:MAG TPA: phosphoglycerate dehydrogenase [Longimicrobiales bacterium]|nr:phosphoglycerate dehydrogenase [Longimicrobiales bacterium]
MQDAGARFRVFVADSIAGDGLEPLRSDPRFELVERSGLKGEDLALALADADAVIVRSSTRITRESLTHARRLQVIGRAGVGVDNIDIDAATERGIAVLNAPSGNTISAAELAFALILACVRRVPAADRSMKAGEWDRKSYTGTELYGKTLGLVGAGRIGGEVARRARGFGMRVVAFDPFLSAERAEALEIELCELDDVLRRADVVSLHVPLTDTTAGLIGAEQMAMMRPGSYIVNAARGGVLDESALADAVRSGHIAGAGLDVFAEEPLPADHPLRSLDGAVLTPHLGAATEEAQQNVALEIAEAVRAALADGDMTRAVNAPAIGGEEMRRLRPLLELSERLGRIAAVMVDGPAEHLAIRYSGPVDVAVRPIAAAVVTGVLRRVVGAGAINMVNALHIAEARGIHTERARVGAHGPYEEFIEIKLATPRGEVRVAGAVVAGRHYRVVRINRYRLVVQPRGSLVILQNRDVPGVIGRVGTLLGGHGINIAEYHQSRLQAGEDALAAISVDGAIPEGVMRELAGLPDVNSVVQVDLD